MKISCLWIQKELDLISNTCIQSWLNLNYDIIIYTYADTLDFINSNTVCSNSRIEVMDANTILSWDTSTEDYLPLSDLFRFTLLSKQDNCLWLDTDMFLLKELPPGNYVSSEFANKTGAFVPKDRTYTANIGVISQIKKIIDWDKIIKSCLKNNKKQNSNKNNFMKIYQKEIHSNYFELVRPAQNFCPIHWAFANSIYEEDDIIGCKYGIEHRGIEDIVVNSIGIHLWRNLYKTKQYVLQPGSVFRQLQQSNNFNYKICIPSYRREEELFSKTYNLIKKYNIPRVAVNIFVSDQKDYTEYKEMFPKINIVLVPEAFKGIGAVRSFITNEWSNDKDKIVMIDDDIEFLKNEDLSHCNLKNLIIDFFEKLQDHNLNFGGLPLCSNTFFFKDVWTTTLKYCSGAFQCIIVDRSKTKISTPYRHYEDFYFNLAYFHRDGGILRYNAIAPITRNYNPNGGIAEECGGMDKRLEVCDKVADEIIHEFGSGAVKKYNKKRSARGPACINLRLNHNYKLFLE